MCWGQAAYCREAQESPGSVSPPWKTYSTRRSMKRSPRRKQPEGAETQLNLREQVRRIQLETLRPPFVSVIGIILPVVIAVESLSCVWLFRHPNDCSLSDSSVHGILQARILKWVAISFSRGSIWPRNWTYGLLHCRQMIYQLSYDVFTPFWIHFCIWCERVF